MHSSLVFYIVYIELLISSFLIDVQGFNIVYIHCSTVVKCLGIFIVLLAGSALAKVLGIYIALLAGHFPLKVHGIDIILFLGSALVGVCLFARKLFPLRC